MISEPELTGGPLGLPGPRRAPDDTGHTPYDAWPTPAPPWNDDDLLSCAGREPAAPRRLPRHWRWAFGGALAASAVWAAAAVAWEPAAAPDAPDLHGYHLTANPCAGGALAPLFAAAPPRGLSADPADTLRGAALARTECSAENLAGDSGGAYDYRASLSVELHRTTDPRPEFDDRHRYTPSSVTRLEPVPGLGDEAYLLHLAGGGLRLDVLHGGAEISLSYSVTPDRPQVTAHPDGSAPPAARDPGLFAPRMAAAVRNVMALMKALPTPTGSAARGARPARTS